MVTLTIDSAGAERIQRKLKLIAKKTSDMKPAFKETGELLVKSYKENIDQKGKKLDVTWKPRLWNYPHPILNKTGKLKQAFEVSKLDKFMVQVRNPLEYANYHHYGTKAHGPKTASFLQFQLPDGRIIRTKKVEGLPPRKLIGLGKILIQDIVEIFNRFLNAAITA